MFAKRKDYLVACFLSSWLWALVMAATAFSCSDQEERKGDEEKKRFGVVVLPIVFYMPETKWGGGAGGLITYRPSRVLAEARPSSLYFYVIYTQLKQFSTQARPELYLKNEEYLLTGKVVAETFPDKFWGIGSDTADEAEEDYTPRTFSVEAYFQKKVWPKQKMYAGLYGQFENYRVTKCEHGGMLENQVYPGSTGGTTSSLGLILSWDTRDNIFFSTRGHYHQVFIHFSRGFLGSDFETTTVKLDLRKFLPVFSKHVLGWQVLFHSVQGHPSFRNYAKLGGDMMMRGYYSGRYRDKYFLGIQGEYRMPVWKRWGLAAFAGIGNVASRLGGFKLDEFKYSLGFGLRFKVSAREGTNLRLDFAWGKGTSGFYFTGGEAF